MLETAGRQWIVATNAIRWAILQKTAPMMKLMQGVAIIVESLGIARQIVQIGKKEDVISAMNQDILHVTAHLKKRRVVADPEGGWGVVVTVDVVVEEEGPCATSAKGMVTWQETAHQPTGVSKLALNATLKDTSQGIVPTQKSSAIIVVIWATWHEIAPKRKKIDVTSPLTNTNKSPGGHL